MATATITRKGQITIPKSVRTNLEAGHRVEFIETEAGFLVKPVTASTVFELVSWRHRLSAVGPKRAIAKVCSAA